MRNPLGFSNIHSVAKHQKKCRGDPLRKKNFEKKIRKKCLAVPKKNERGDSLVSPGMICYAEKQVNSFWSSSLGQMVLFDTIIFCRTFKNYFGQFVWIEKKKKKKSHYNSRVSLHEAPTKNNSVLTSVTLSNCHEHLSQGNHCLTGSHHVHFSSCSLRLGFAELGNLVPVSWTKRPIPFWSRVPIRP